MLLRACLCWARGACEGDDCAHFGAWGCSLLRTYYAALSLPNTAGDAWVQLLAKLMVSSEEVAATLISRQPSGELILLVLSSLPCSFTA